MEFSEVNVAGEGRITNKKGVKGVEYMRDVIKIIRTKHLEMLTNLSRKPVSAEIIGENGEPHKIVPHEKGHYTTRDVEFLSAKLNARLLHERFKEKHPNVVVTYIFVKMFHESSNWPFGRPQVGT
ncbi:hypothetical protein PR048_004782 [Dryococelus australis]|uniref:Uncharacterized protein n=1 Tax=Dryococelus australis TaxID=614101 RepID=A0ABQ9I6D8_9NEOP|nr:hypothetical protein PR048_004782 [Dryococelus australis]